MKILQINKFYYLRGGSEKYLSDLNHVLIQHRHKVIPFSMKHEKNWPTPYAKYFTPKIDFDDLSGKTKPSFANKIFWSTTAAKNVDKLLKKERPDVAHLHNIAHQITPSIIPVLKKHKIPMIMTLHDLQLACPNYQMFINGKVCERCRKHRYYNCIKYRCMKGSLAASAFVAAEMVYNKLSGIYEKNITTFITPSKFMKDKMVQWGVDGNKIEYLFNFMDTKQYKPSKKIGDYLLYFGRLVPEKGVMVIVKAVAALPKAKLCLVGSGPLQTEIEEFIKKNKVKNIKLLGYKSGQDLVDTISNSRFVVLASQLYENAPMSILEAMSMSRPAIVSRIGGIPEMIVEGKNGYTVKPGDVNDMKKAISKMYFAPNKTFEMGKFARQHVADKFNAENHYKGLMKIYQNAIDINKTKG